MKKRVTCYFVIILLFTGAYSFYILTRSGKIFSEPLVKAVYPTLHAVASLGTDLKFRLRGPLPPKPRVVIISIDSDSLNRLGRWPWRRDIMAFLIHQLRILGVKTVGVDVLFTEPMSPVNEELRDILNARGDSDLLKGFDFDSKLSAATKRHRENVVMEWYSESPCRKGLGDCPHSEPPPIPVGFEKFQIPVVNQKSLSLEAPSLWLSTKHVAAPFDALLGALEHSGFPNVARDKDGVTRTAALVMEVEGKLYPSFPLEVARTFLGEKLEAQVNAAGTLLTSLRLGERDLSSDGVGNYEINYRGEESTFPQIPVWKVLEWAENPEERHLAWNDGRELLPGSIALVGATAHALGDVHATPFDGITPGVEVLANIVDNILENDGLKSSPQHLWVLLALLTVGAALFLQAGERLEARHFAAVVLCAFSGVMVWDYAFLFRYRQNIPSAFLYLEMLTLTAVCLIFKYLAEENKRKFIRLAFSKYVSPAVVDSLIQDHGQLSLGGRRETLTILFSDIRGFTTFSETVEAKVLSQFLNEFHGMMTEIIFQHGGTLDKYIGDAVMAFWGAPLFQPDHASRALSAALKMLEALEKSQDRFEATYGFRPKVGLGIQTGVVSVGNMGSEKSFGYTVIGDPVNLASRLEGATKQFGASILTTDSTLKSIQESGMKLPSHRVIGPVRTKGKQTSVLVVEVLANALPPESTLLFEQGKEAFRGKRWEEAKASFQKLIERQSGDGPSETYLRLCDDFALHPPAADWDGSWALTEK